MHNNTQPSVVDNSIQWKRNPSPSKIGLFENGGNRSGVAAIAHAAAWRRGRLRFFGGAFLKPSSRGVPNGTLSVVRAMFLGPNSSKLVAAQARTIYPFASWHVR